ncbi:unnamed protein product [Diatraea saccharalis]|uniref:FLYWCH-type domain-containing protein n=1 Tax=Diatraea saccharalis TaxID=40085 RepID=A0A9N9WCG2_9NEOP|nr:unnamed protein product [Diatraea saccharalis]
MEYKIITAPGQKQVMLFRGYTFSFKGMPRIYAYCSKYYTLGCKARFRLDKDGKIVYADTIHNHNPPVYRRTPVGKLVKVMS